MLSLKYICALMLLHLNICGAQEAPAAGITQNIGAITETSSTTIAVESSTTPVPTDPTTAKIPNDPGINFNTAINIDHLINEISTTTNNVNNVESGTTTTSPWELIYPDPNTTRTTTSDDNSKLPNFQTPQGFSQGVSKYFKVDDVVNCEKYFGECLRQVLSIVMPRLRNSQNASHLANAVDPFFVSRNSFQYNGGPLNGRITVGYAYVYGLASMKYRKVIFKRTAGNNFKLRLSATIPALFAKGTYKADLKLNSVDVRPRGDMNITLLGIAVEQLAYGQVIEEDQHRFLRATGLNVTAAVRDARINATGLIADARLNDIILNVANQYWRDIFNIVLPETKDNWSPIIMNGLNRALSMVPFDFLQLA
ncbi:uncharacterized protein [Musca autumnalis]|uniref:uncharacterized protein n=1 Tax=Musca autumnalis TaxID=221902 RepID=UPI003CFA8EFE